MKIENKGGWESAQAIIKSFHPLHEAILWEMAKIAEKLNDEYIAKSRPSTFFAGLAYLAQHIVLTEYLLTNIQWEEKFRTQVGFARAFFCTPTSVGAKYKQIGYAADIFNSQNPPGFRPAQIRK